MRYKEGNFGWATALVATLLELKRSTVNVKMTSRDVIFTCYLSFLEKLSEGRKSHETRKRLFLAVQTKANHSERAGEDDLGII